MNDLQELSSLNENLLTEFSVKELEERLETDPMMFGNPMDSSMPASGFCFDCTMCFSCGEF